MLHFLITRQQAAAGLILVLCFCLVVDVFTILPRRVWEIRTEFFKTGDQKLLEQWGGFYAASRQIRGNAELGTKVGLPTLQYSESHRMPYAYGHGNYNALVYPGRAVTLAVRADLERARPAFMVLDGEWPPFTFPGDPRAVDPGRPVSPRVVPVRYDDTAQ